MAVYVEGHSLILAALTCAAAANVPKDLPPASGIQSQPGSVPILHTAVTSGSCVEGAATDEPGATLAPRLNVSAASAVLF